MSLSPWDLSANISFDFSLYRPRRPSYVFATQTARQRNESYRHATKHGSTSGGGGPSLNEPPGGAAPSGPDRPDIIEGIARKKRKESYRAATQRANEDIEVEPAGSTRDANHVTTGSDGVDASLEVSRRRYTKNLVVMSVSFVLVLTAFRAIQNLESSLNAPDRLGVVAMTCVHCTMFITSPFAPSLIHRLGSKWTIVLGMLFYLFWIAANFCPHFYTLVPTSIGVGFGQSLAWSAQIAYMRHLASDYERLAGSEVNQRTLYRFNGVFLACFQTSHVWGNLVSSLALREEPSGRSSGSELLDEGILDEGATCGIYDACHEKIPFKWNTTDTANAASNGVLRMMGTYLVFAFSGLLFILIFLERIPSSKDDPDKPCIQMLKSQVLQLYKHKTFCRLIPMLLFNGFEQGFVYADFNRSYVSCTIGIHYIGYCMITLGATNSVFSFVVGAMARHIPREAVVGIGAILHVGLMVFLLVWIPDKGLVAVFFVISGLWGICDAIWQTQSNYLVNLCCPDDTELAFQNLRLLQGFGASMAFILSIFFCISVKLYLLITLLAISILFYVVVEYDLRRNEQTDDDASRT